LVNYSIFLKEVGHYLHFQSTLVKLANIHQ
jgi:hypothetical protein